MIIRDFAERCCLALGKLGMTLADEHDITLGRALAARTVSPAITTVETLSRVQTITRCSSFVLKSGEDLAAVLAVIPLTPAALPSLAAGIFDGVNPPEDLIARPGEGVAAYYGWGMAGATWRGRGTIMSAALKLRWETFPCIPLYGRAATPGGERTLLGRLGATSVPGPGGLVMAEPASPCRKVA